VQTGSCSKENSNFIVNLKTFTIGLPLKSMFLNRLRSERGIFSNPNPMCFCKEKKYLGCGQTLR